MTDGTATPVRPGRRAEHGGFARVLHAEWTKFRTVRGWVIGMVAAALMVVLVAVLAGWFADRGDRNRDAVHHRRIPGRPDLRYPGRQPAAGPGAGGQGDRTGRGHLRRRAGGGGRRAPAWRAARAGQRRLSLTGVELGQALVAILAAGVISGEYSSGMIRTTLTGMPHRATVLAAKAVTLTGVVAAAGTVAVLGSLLAGRLILPALPFPRHLPGNRRSALAAPAPADRADERRARHPGHHRSPQPAHRSMGRPRRPRRLGHHGAPDRRAAAPAARRVNASPRGANGKIL
jgi:hypothetical protein